MLLLHFRRNSACLYPGDSCESYRGSHESVHSERVPGKILKVKNFQRIVFISSSGQYPFFSGILQIMNVHNLFNLMIWLGKLFTLSALQVFTSRSLIITFRNLNLINVCSPPRPRRGYCRPAALLSDSGLSRIRPPGPLTVSTTCVQIARIRYVVVSCVFV